MKRNVDLTEDMVFSNRAANIERFLKDLSDSYVYPWEIEHKIENQKHKTIATGNRNDRKEIESFRQLDSGDYCDCCGESLIKIPWDRTYGVCKKCSNYYGFEKPKLWRRYIGN